MLVTEVFFPPFPASLLAVAKEMVSLLADLDLVCCQCVVVVVMVPSVSCLCV